MTPQLRRWLSTVVFFVLFAFTAVNITWAAPAPGVTLTGTGAVFIGASPIEMSVTFDNTAPTGAANIGYGPFIDLYFPRNGADGAAGSSLPLDGVDYIAGSATYLGIPVTETILTFPAGPLGGSCPAGQSPVTHPYAQTITQTPVTVCGVPGDKLVVFQIPFGSFTPEQPPATIDFQASLSNYADLNVPLNFYARGGFTFGTDPLDNPCCDPSYFSDPTPSTITDNPVGSITPTLIELSKEVDTPEGETATGPNYPRQYTVTVTAAPGQPITNLDVFDYFDDNIVITAINAPGSSSITIGGVPPVYPFGPVVANGTANRLVVSYATLPANPTTFTISFYVPLLDAAGAPVLPPATAGDSVTENRANTIGDWDPLDPRDPAGTNNAVAGDGACPACPPTVTHTNESMPIQKSNTNLTDSNPSPGDVIQYTLNIQLSDFFALDNVTIYDVISDGQRLTGTPQISFTQHGASFSNTVNPANIDVREYFTGGAPGVGGLPDPNVSAAAGDTVLAINLSGEVIAELGLNEILGGCVPVGGTGAGNPDCAVFNGGSTSVTLTYQTTVLDAFTDDFLSGDPSVDHGDTLDNVASLRANTVLNTTNLAPTGAGSASTDDTSSEINIAQGETEKTIYAITDSDTGITTLNPPGVPQIRPGDVITFRLTYQMPSSDFEDFSLSDFLPLPVLDANEITVFNDVISNGSTTVGAGIPAAGQAMWGPTPAGSNFAAIAGTLQNGLNVPTITTPGGTIPAICGGTAIVAAENYVNFCFGDYDDTSNRDSVIDVLLSVTVTDDPFADELFLTNFVRGGTGSTNAGGAISDQIVQFELRQPILSVRKGIGDSSNPNQSFDTPPSGAIAGAGDPSVPPFTPPIDNNDVDTGFDSNVDGLDAGDTVRFVITIENTGGAAAYDIRLVDFLPAGLICNPANVNLNVTLGDGTPVSYLNIGGGSNPCDFFTSFDPDTNDGIELIDPAEGLCQHPDVDPTRAVILITYDLTIDNIVAAGDILTNTTTLTNYANSENGDTHLPDPTTYPEDSANVGIAGTMVKDIVSTSAAFTSDTQTGVDGDERPVTIGEVIRYRTYISFPEGATANLQFRDNLPDGLIYAGNPRFAFISTSGSALSSTDVNINAAGPGLPGSSVLTPTAVFPASAITGGTTSGEDILFSLGTVTNSENDSDSEFVVLEFDVRVADVPANTTGTQLINTITLRKGGADVATSETSEVILVEPRLTIRKGAIASSSAAAIFAPALGPTPANSNVSNIDAGDTVTFRATVVNTGTSPAFNVTLTDAPPAQFTGCTLGTVRFDNGTTPVFSGDLFTTPLVLDSASPLAPNGVINNTGTDVLVVEYTCTVALTALQGVTYTNTITVNSFESLPGGPAESRTYTGPNDPATTRLIESEAYKQILSTSETHTSNASLPQTGATNIPVTIGEVVRYRLVIDVPEGTSTDLLIIDQLSTGIAPIFDTTTEISTLNFNTGFDSVDFGAGLQAASSGTVDLHNGTSFVFTTPFNLVDYNAGSNLLTFNLGDIVNNDSDANTEQIILDFNVVVLNGATVDLGDIIANDFDVYTDNASGTSILRDASNVVNLIVQEPRLGITKTASPTSGDSGDPITFTVTVQNTGAIDAFNVTVADTFDPRFNVTGVSTPTTTGLGAAYTESARTVTASSFTLTFDRLPVGDSVTYTITADLLPTVTIGDVIDNTVTTTWTSLPGGQGSGTGGTGSGTPGTSGSPDGERNGSGGVNDYTASDSLNTLVTVTGTVSTVKSIDGTTEPHTPDSSADTPADPRPLVVGEVITYRLVTAVPEGTSPDVNVIDILSPNIEYVIGSARISYSANETMTIPGAPGLNEIQPSTPIPGGLISFGLFGPRQLRFDIGQVINNDDDDAASDELLIIEFDVVVVNTADNLINAIWANNYSVDLNNDGTSDSTSNSVHHVIREPVITASKAIVGAPPVDALEDVTYDITITAGSGPNETIAYDVRVFDQLNADLELLSVNIQSAPGYVSIISNSSTFTAGGAVDLVLNRLEPGDSVVLRVVAGVQTTVSPGETIPNSAVITWTSTPGAQGTNDNTPGASGSTDGERNGSGGVNDYTTPTNTVNFTVSSPEPQKSIAGTSESDTSEANDGSVGNERPVAIGEVVTYRLVTTLPESTTISFRMDDVLVDGIEFVTGSARVSYIANDVPSFNGDFSGITNSLTPTFAFPAGRISFNAVTRTLSFDFGSIINNDGDPDAERIILEFDVVVVDESINSTGQIWENDFSLVIDEGLPTQVITTSNTVGIEVVEPEVTLTKSFSPDELVRGGTVTMTLIASNLAADGATTSAFDLNVTDVLDDWLNVTNVDVDFNAAAQTFGSAATDNSAITAGFATGVTDNIEIAINGLPIDGVATITVTMQVDPNADPLLLSRTISNTATVTSDTLVSDNTPDDEDREYSTPASDTLNVVKPTLRVTKTDSIDPVTAGALMSYTVTIENTGTPNYPATGVILTDAIPPGFTVTLVQPSQGTCSPISGGVLTCSIGTIASGASANVVITGRYPSTTASGTIANNIAYVTSTEGNNGNDGNDTPTDNDDERAEEETTILRQTDLSITKIVDDATPNEGDLITFTLTVRNNGPSQASNVVVIDTLPADLTFVRFVPVSLPCVYAAPTLTCTFPTLNVGATRTIGIETTVDAGASVTGTITNTATVTSTEPETNLTNNDDDATITVDGVDLQVVKTVSNPTPAEGASISYTITVTNLGPAPATGISITDDFSGVNGITYVSDNSATTSTTYDSVTGLWTLNNITLNAGESLSLVINASVDVGASALVQPIINTATLTTVDQPDGNPDNDEDTAEIAVNGLDLRLTKGVSNPAPTVGATIVYSIIVENLGAANATNIVVLDQLDTLPLNYVSHVISRTGTTYDPVTGTWTIPNLRAGRSIRLDITMTVNAAAAGATVTNVASITAVDQSDANPNNNSDDAVITVGGVDLAVVKTVNNPTPSEGDTVIFTVTVTNNGPSVASGVFLTDLLPAGVTFVSSNRPDRYNPVSGEWRVGSLNVGASRSLQITVTVDAGTSGTSITNTASLTTSTPTDGNPANNTDEAIITVGGLDLAVTKTVDQGTANEGDTLIYSITVENFGAENATSITVTDDLSGLPLTYVSDNSASLLDSAGNATAYDPLSGAWTIGALDAGSSLTLQITVTVDAGTSGTNITNTAILTSVDQNDADPGNNDDSVTVPVGGVDIAVEKTVDNPAPTTGSDVTYTITVTNVGDGTATGVSISENLPLDGVSLSYVSHVASQGTFTVGTPGTWTIGTLTGGQSVTLQLTVTVEISDGQIVNVASLSSVDQPDGNPDNNEDTVIITLNGVDLSVVKTVDNAAPNTGDTVTYSLVATNNGPGTATGVTVTDILPAGINYVSDNAATLTDDLGTANTFDPLTGDWVIGTLNSGSTRTLTITVQVLVNGGQIINIATISANESESDDTNNTDEAIISVDSADLSLVKTVNTTTPQIGDFITYTITVSNAGPNIAYNVAVTDTLPSTVSYTGTHIASQGSFNGSLWTVGSLPVGSAATLQITVQVISNTGTFVNVAEVTASDQSDPDSTPNNGDPGEDDYDESSFLFDPPFGRKVFNAAGLPELEWTIVWVNPNDAPLAVDVSDPIPAGTTFIPGSLTCTSPGTLVTTNCAFDIVTGNVNFSGTIFPDTGITPATIDSASNPLIITFRVSVPDDVNEVRNEALLTSTNGDNVPVESTWERELPNTPEQPAPSEIRLTKYASPSIAFPGQTLTWILEITNPSANPALGIVVTDVLPEPLTIETTQAEAGVVERNGQEIIWRVDSLAPTQTLELRIVTRVSEDLDAPVTNTARATGTNFDPRESSFTAEFVERLPNTGEPRAVSPLWIVSGAALLIGVFILIRRGG